MNLLKSNISSRFARNMANFDPLMAKIIGGFGAPQQISTVFESWLCYCSDVVQRRPIKLCRMFGRLLGWYTIYFSGAFAPDGILPSANFTLCPSPTFSYIGSVTARHSTSGCQPNFALWYKD